jgi:hypothetical protein
MNTLLTLLTICIVVVVYMHVVYQLKTSNDLELFELDTPIKTKLEEVCNLRQPLLFPYSENDINQLTPAKLLEYKAFDVTVYDSSYNSSLISLNSAFQLFDKKNYFSNHNSEFLHETMLSRYFITTDAYLRPPMVSAISYDILFGASGSTSQLEYSTQHRNYMYVSNGVVTVKLTPPRNAKYLDVEKDYAKQQYYSKVHPWNNSLDKVKFLEITLAKGQMLFIPAYWWYSVKFEKDACLCTLQYKTVMNIIATLPDICIGILQRQNTKIKINPTSLENPSSSDVSHTSAVPDEPR